MILSEKRHTKILFLGPIFHLLENESTQPKRKEISWANI